MIPDEGRSVIFLLEKERYVSVVKATQSGEAAFLTSLRRFSSRKAKANREVARLRGKASATESKEGAGGGASQSAQGGNPT
jgi:hypothetical protein